MEKVDAYSALETCQRVSQAGVAKARLSWAELIIKSFLGGMLISLGSGFDLVVAGGATGLRATNPSIATMLAGFTFPIGFVLVVINNLELCTSNMIIMAYSTLQRKTSICDLTKNWVVSYVGNMAGCLFFAGILTWWSDALNQASQSSFAVTQAEGRVNVNWGYNFTRGIGCNWLVGFATLLATSGRDNSSKIVGIWLPVWAFVGLGYQHSIANFYLVPIGMFYGTNFGVGKFIYQSVIPVTLGNIIGGSVMIGVVFWFLYGRDESMVANTSQPYQGETKLANGTATNHYIRDDQNEHESEETCTESSRPDSLRRRRSGGSMV